MEALVVLVLLVAGLASAAALVEAAALSSGPQFDAFVDIFLGLEKNYKNKRCK